MYYGDSISDPYVKGGMARLDEHPCLRCGRMRRARKAWTFCADCRLVDPEMCRKEVRNGTDRAAESSLATPA